MKPFMRALDTNSNPNPVAAKDEQAFLVDGSIEHFSCAKERTLVHQIRGYEIGPGAPQSDTWAELLELRRQIQRENDLARGLRPDVVCLCVRACVRACVLTQVRVTQVREPSVIGAVALPNPHAEAWAHLSVCFCKGAAHRTVAAAKTLTTQDAHEAEAQGRRRHGHRAGEMESVDTTWSFISQMSGGCLHGWRVAQIDAVVA